jgi:hypothetical protein
MSKKKLSKLKTKADDLLEKEFIWFDSPLSKRLSIGVDWDTEQIVIVDLDHPNGPAIQSSYLLDMDTFYEEEN